MKIQESVGKIKKVMAAVKDKMTYTQIIALGYFSVILAGTLLLLLPLATRAGEHTSFLTALFTATSSTCVTGLVVVDTSLHWTVFGQIVIILMIQVGGLGFVTMGVLFSMFLRRKISLSTRRLLQESMNANQLGGMVKLVRGILKGTLLFEGTGAILLAIRFVPQYGFLKGVYYSVFHAISAFCNAGFDLMGAQSGAYSSFVSYVSDPIVPTVFMILIVVGGIGFFVWQDLAANKWNWKKYSLHTKLVLSSTAVLLIGGTIVYYLLERQNVLEGMSAGEGIFAAMFSSVTARTAGFNTTDIGGLTTASKLFTMVLMFIGGSPGSTAGGIKTVTLMVMLVYVWSNLRGRRSCNIFGRRLDDENIKKASNVIVISILLAVTAILALSCMQPELLLEDLMLEVFSAIGTVGMSAGITRSLTTASRLIVILLMFCGRIGSMSFALSFTERKKVAPVQLPGEKVMIG